MKVAGIIVEYNPFHKGHAYMIEEAKKKAGADRVVVVMSGSFVQRGEPALLSKFDRADLAIRAGMDLVIELPVAFSTASGTISTPITFDAFFERKRLMLPTPE